jgi:hypothetical protein
MLSFTSEPNIGTIVRMDDQEFELIDATPHVRKDGPLKPVKGRRGRKVKVRIDPA